MESKGRFEVLVVDDDPESIVDLVGELKRDRRIREKVVTDFDQAKSMLMVKAPDIVVIDLVRAGDGVPGVELSAWAWENGVFPIVIYTAQRGAYDGPIHAFIEVIQKGGGSENEVVAAILKYGPYGEALRDAQERARRDMAQCIRDAYPPMAEHDEAGKGVDALTRAARRRFAAMLDEGRSGEDLDPWEQYVCPPLSSSPLTGDILRSAAGSDDRPEEFSVVLTPSCDLVQDEKQEPRVRRVLVAKCVNMGDALKMAGYPMTGTKVDVRRVERIVGRGYEGGVLFLPRLPGLIPPMAANLRELDLLPLDEIGKQGDDAQHVRVASVDSPFRELVSWAYLQHAGRLGLPGRDREKWAEEVRVSILGLGGKQ